ncbi:MerR family transcriptional regulator [Salipaludibacillus sp. HK11]|uniref:MerR family transcriptional regulator n=1 Tax=Salipaludibacillus sp. HK11 TaxID=3394320 RepID=UPI0039FC3A04
MYTIGQLSKKTGVTVRTLDYYGEVNLIIPSSKTEGGHRLYSENDVMRLQQVLALKYMGFSLEKIKGILKENTSTWQQSVDQQLEMIKQKIIQLEALEQALNGVKYSIEFEGDVNWNIIFKIIRLFQENPAKPFEMLEESFSKEELNRIIGIKGEQMEEVNHQWIKLIHEIRENIDQEPASPVAQQLARQWMNLVHTMFGEDEAFLDKMWSVIKEKQDGILFYPMDREVVNFMDKTITIMYEREAQK